MNDAASSWETASASRNSGSKNIGYVPGASTTGTVFGGGVISIPQYAATDRHKHILDISGNPELMVVIHSARWENTAAITSIVLAPSNGSNLVAGSVFELWGLVAPDDEAVTRETKAMVTT